MLLISLLFINTIIYGQSPQPLLELTALPVSQTNERLFDFYVEDASLDLLRIRNGTSGNGQFMPVVHGHKESDPRHGLYFVASTSESNDISNNSPLMLFDARIMNYADHMNDEITDQQALENRLLFAWSNLLQYKMVLSASGNLGIGNLNPEHKIQVTDGDVFIEDIDKGVIMKSPNGNCWRITVGDDGNVITTLLQNCQ